MKLSSLKVLLASVAVASFAFAGCASDPAQSEEEGDAVESSEAEISSLSSRYVGKFEWHEIDSGDFVDFHALDLKSNGRYEAKVDSRLVNPSVQCIAFPCTLPESGTWFAYRSWGQIKIRVNPRFKPSRSYYATLAADGESMKLRRFGRSTKLFKEPTITCANVDCVSGHICQMQNGEPVCVPPITCANVLCAPNTFCQMVGNEPQCLPQTGCEAVSCITGSNCQMQNGQPVCVPNAQPCQKTGCSSHICADRDMITTCEFRPEYACYQQATCERQANGQCGFTQTPALQACLSQHQ